MNDCLRASEDSREILDVENMALLSVSTASTSAVRHIMGFATSISSLFSSYFIFSSIFDFNKSKFLDSGFLGSKSSSSSKLDWSSAS